ncbi:MAG TPA: hypothetical protein VJ873_02710, partial [bacterium]|nr:hypothetical protein [bacterium]
MNKLLDWFSAQIVHWMWATPEGLPVYGLEYADLSQPEGAPVKHKRLGRPLRGRGSAGEVLKPIHEFYHRGAYERHEGRIKRISRTLMRFRGKGAKIERRHKKR